VVNGKQVVWVDKYCISLVEEHGCARFPDGLTRYFFKWLKVLAYEVGIISAIDFVVEQTKRIFVGKDDYVRKFRVWDIQTSYPVFPGIMS
jgi:hypothetical protein